MSKITLYRYDPREFEEGEMIESDGDHYDRLAPEEKQVEIVVRQTLDNGFDVRSTSLYTWRNQRIAEVGWKYKKGYHLYELEADEEDIICAGDLEHFSRAKDSVRKGEDPSQHVKAYCEGDIVSDRIEVLVEKATVVRRLRDNSERKFTGGFR